MKTAEKYGLAKETIKFPVHYDQRGQTVRDANGLMVCDIRGWGKIQYLKQAEERQDSIGRLIAKLLNESQQEEKLQNPEDYLEAAFI
ncbi:MAG: hypothetical protein WBV11_00300 [Salegentibacter sp.]